MAGDHIIVLTALFRAWGGGGGGGGGTKYIILLGTKYFDSHTMVIHKVKQPNFRQCLMSADYRLQ